MNYKLTVPEYDSATQVWLSIICLSLEVISLTFLGFFLFEISISGNQLVVECCEIELRGQ